MTQKKIIKGDLISNKYEIQFWILKTNLFDRYRVKRKDGKIFLLNIYNLAKQPRGNINESGLNEVNILKIASHNGINNFIDSGDFIFENQKYFFIVFENISGESLSDKISREGPQSQYRALSIIVNLLEIVQYLHSLKPPIIHNNITPFSVWIEDNGGKERIVLSGFEFAREFGNKNSVNDIIKLNPLYKASELLNGVNIPQNDLFSIGALMYYIIFGLPPWHVNIPEILKVNQLKDIIFEAREKDLLFPSLSTNFIEEHIKNSIAKSLETDIQNRYVSAKEFIDELKKGTVLLETEKEIPPKQKKGGFNDIAGMDELKSVLYNDVIRALKDKELYKNFGITIPNGMLLYGPPGCGKTFIAEKFAEEIGFNFVLIKPSDLGSIYIHGSQGKIKELFEAAEKNAPSVLCFDEFDALVPKRSEALHQGIGSEVNEFLSRMTNCGEKGVFVIASSNLPELIDPAILRTGRIDKKILVPPPDKKARELIFKLYLKNRPIDLSIDYENLAELTDRLVSSDLKFIVDESSRIAIQRNQSRINMEILMEAIGGIDPPATIEPIPPIEPKEPFGFSLP